MNFNINQHTPIPSHKTLHTFSKVGLKALQNVYDDDMNTINNSQSKFEPKTPQCYQLQFLIQDLNIPFHF